MKHIAAAAALALATSACADRQPPIDPKEAFAEVEGRLLSANTLEMWFEISAAGALTSSFTGTLSLSSGNVLDLQASGHFDGSGINAALRSDGQRLSGGATAGSIEVATPGALTEAMVVGLTRMGLLHNIARLSGDAAPDHADGGVREWVTVSSFVLEDRSEASGVYGVTFELMVENVPSGKATLWIDSETGLPVRREQTVQFGAAEMRVLERYSSIKVLPE